MTAFDCGSIGPAPGAVGYQTTMRSVRGVPGLTTTAALVLRLWLSPARLKLVNVPFQEVVSAVKSGKVLGTVRGPVSSGKKKK